MESFSFFFFFFSSRRRHTRCSRDWSSDVCSSDLHQSVATVALWPWRPAAPRSNGSPKAPGLAPTAFQSPRVRVVLASASPRRRELLRQICPEFEVVPSEIEETLPGGPTPEAVSRLALRKARAVAARVEGAVVLAADTVVVFDGEAL